MRYYAVPKGYWLILSCLRGRFDNDCTGYDDYTAALRISYLHYTSLELASFSGGSKREEFRYAVNMKVGLLLTRNCLGDNIVLHGACFLL